MVDSQRSGHEIRITKRCPSDTGRLCICFCVTSNHTVSCLDALLAVAFPNPYRIPTPLQPSTRPLAINVPCGLEPLYPRLWPFLVSHGEALHANSNSDDLSWKVRFGRLGEWDELPISIACSWLVGLRPSLTCTDASRRSNATFARTAQHGLLATPSTCCSAPRSPT